MIHVVAGENRAIYRCHLSEQHRIRHQVYVEERRWTGLESRDGMEFDAFDTPDTIYLLAIENERVVGGTRLNATTNVTLLETVCPQLANVKGFPKGPDILEWTRIYAIKEKRAGGSLAGGVVGELFAATFEFALQEGISELSVQFEAWWMPRLHQHGWTIRPLGLPALINEEWWIAATIPVTEAAVRSVRKFYQLRGPLLVRNGLTSRIHEPATWNVA